MRRSSLARCRDGWQYARSFPKPNVYLTPDTMHRDFWRGELEEARDGPFIGICWRSGNMAGHRTLQYAPWKPGRRSSRGCRHAGLCAIRCAARGDRGTGTVERGGGSSRRRRSTRRTSWTARRLCSLLSTPWSVRRRRYHGWRLPSAPRPARSSMDTAWTSFGQVFEPFAPACSVMMPKARGDWADVFAQTLSRIAARG